MTRYAPPSVQRIMAIVLASLLPAAAVHVWLFGPGLVANVAIASAAALASEAAVLALRRRPVAPALADGSALVAAVLLAFTLPPDVPWWIPAIGASFAIVFAKQLYGGLGMNPFNPAMVGYVVLLVSFPVEMTAWRVPWDTVTGATPLDALRTAVASGERADVSLQHPLFGHLAGAGWEWLALAFALGGGVLLATRVIRWPIPAAMLGALAVLATAAWLVDPARFGPPSLHLLAASTMLGAFFIATDPVTAATTPAGRLWYGAGIGVLTWVLRSFGGYPDGIAFAVLLMNMAAPAIDHFTGKRA